jgi:hypothetical protein
VSVTWQGFGGQPFAKTGCADGAVDEGVAIRSCSVTTTTDPILSSGAVSETVKHDSRPPVVTYTGNTGYTIDQQVTIDCSASDPVPGSGLDSDTCDDVDAPAWSFALGGHTLSATAKDVAGNQASGSATFTVGVTFTSLENVVTEFCSNPATALELNQKLAEAEKAKKAAKRAKKLGQFEKQVDNQVGTSLTSEEAVLLVSFAEALK